MFNALSATVGGIALMTTWIPEQPAWVRATDGWPLASIVAGTVMAYWIVGEIASIRAFHPLQVIYLVTGVLVVVLTPRARRAAPVDGS